MISAAVDDLHGFSLLEPALGSGAPEVYVSNDGSEPVVLVHELPQLTPAVVALARFLEGSGFRVYLPSLLGSPGRDARGLEAASLMLQACVRSELRAAFGTGTRGVVGHLRRLVDRVSGPHGRVGVVGLCFSGGFALAAATHARVAAAVACEPSLPLADGSAIDLSAEDGQQLRARLEAGDLAARIYRFQGDRISPCRRLCRYAETLGPQVTSRCLPDCAADPRQPHPPHHSVMTKHLVDEEGSLTRAARGEMISFLEWRLRGGAAPEENHGLRDCLIGGCVKPSQAGGPIRP